VLAVVGFFLYSRHEAVPDVPGVLLGQDGARWPQNANGASAEPEKVRELFFKRLDINYRKRQAGQLKFDRVNGGWRMKRGLRSAPAADWQPRRGRQIRSPRT
jgi:hypothetical protein